MANINAHIPGFTAKSFQDHALRWAEEVLKKPTYFKKTASPKMRKVCFFFNNYGERGLDLFKQCLWEGLVIFSLLVFPWLLCLTLGLFGWGLNNAALIILGLSISGGITFSLLNAWMVSIQPISPSYFGRVSQFAEDFSSLKPVLRSWINPDGSVSLYALTMLETLRIEIRLAMEKDNVVLGHHLDLDKARTWDELNASYQKLRPQLSKKSLYQRWFNPPKWDNYETLRNHHTLHEMWKEQEVMTTHQKLSTLPQNAKPHSTKRL